jgi:hypothetical protein
MIKAAVAGRETIPYEDSNARYKNLIYDVVLLMITKVKVHHFLVITVEVINPQTAVKPDPLACTDISKGIFPYGWVHTLYNVMLVGPIHVL